MITNSHQFEALFTHATIGMIVTGKTGKIINFNKYAETQLGYTKDEVVGKTVDILVLSKIHSVHHKHREGFYKHPEPRRMGEGRDLFAQKKDGTEFPVEISLSNYEISGEIFVIAFVIDITVRKKMRPLFWNKKMNLNGSLDNATPADVYYGRKEQILKRREKIKRQSLQRRRSNYLRQRLQTIN